jgi:2-polyprenyl-3-methyl-5-hydroxy-6-metoxy-1,4-benzoquinol methylase
MKNYLFQVALRLRDKITGAGSVRDAICRQVQASHQELQSLRLELQSLPQDQQALREELQSLRETLQSLPDDQRALRGELQSFRQELRSLPQDQQALRVELQSFRQELRSLPQDQQALREALQSLRQALQSLPQDQQTLHGELQCLRQELQTFLHGRQTFWHDLQQELESLRSLCARSHGALTNYVLANTSAAPSPPVEEQFRQHYVEWREKRVACIVNHYGLDFFRGKHVLELGAGHGHIGAELAGLGAGVTCAEAREEHLQVIAERHPMVRIRQVDLNREWPFDEPFDLILHMGVLYHLEEPGPTIRAACRSCKHLVLETEVCDSLDPEMIIPTCESGYDQSISGRGCRPSSACVERLLRECTMEFDRVSDGSCNSGIHVYDWKELDTGGWRHGLRRMWFAVGLGPRQS